MLFKDKLKKYRQENNITQNELASRLYVSRTLISKWENGVVYPSAQTMEKLAQIMNVDINYLLSDEETKALTLNNSSKREISASYHMLSIISAVLLTCGVTLLLIGLIFPTNMTTPEDIYNSVNTITVILFIMKALGIIISAVGAILLVFLNIYRIKNKRL